MKNVTLLGTGLQGRTILYDLASCDLVSKVIAADKVIGPAKEFVKGLSSDKIECLEFDATDENSISKLMIGADVIIEVMPGQFTLPIAKLAAQNGVSLVNTMYLTNIGETDPLKIQAAEEEIRQLDKKARKMEITILPELGLDPGIDLIFCGQAVRALDEVHELYSYGAGLPELKAADNPLKYKVSWTFEGVLKSYYRAARILKDGRIVEVAADEIFAKDHTHELELEEIGQLEAYPNGDAIRFAEILGIRNNVKTMGRYALRWPGHCEFWEKMAKLHFLDDLSIKVGDTSVVPREFLGSLLEPQLQYRDHERDIAVIHVDARGVKDGERKRIIYQIIDKRDLKTGFTGMTRTVGFSASIGAYMILRGDIRKRGVLTPTKDVPFDIFTNEMMRRGIQYEHSVSSW